MSDLWYAECQDFLTSAQLSVRHWERKRNREVNQKKRKRVISPFPAKPKREKRTTEKRKGGQSYICPILSLIPSTYIISALKCALNVLVVFYCLSLKRLKWIQLDPDLPSTSYAKARFVYLFIYLFAPCKMCCYRKILAAVYIKLLFFFLPDTKLGCGMDVLSIMWIVNCYKPVSNNCFCCWKTQPFWQDTTLY